MLPEPEIREAIAVLERIVAMGVPGTAGDKLAAELAGLRYVLGEEQVTPSLAATLARTKAIFAEMDAAPEAKREATGGL